jgi:hypothetical protein
VTAYLELQPHPLAAEQKYRGIIATMSDNERSTLYNKIWELAKMHDPRIHGPEWGELHAFDNLALLNSAMHRLGLFEASSLHPVQCLPFHFGEGGLGAQYFSLSERAGRDPEPGWIGFAPTPPQIGASVILTACQVYQRHGRGVIGTCRGGRSGFLGPVLARQ